MHCMAEESFKGLYNYYQPWTFWEPDQNHTQKCIFVSVEEAGLPCLRPS